jgi:hypothetical protein
MAKGMTDGDLDSEADNHPSRRRSSHSLGSGAIARHQNEISHAAKSTQEQ